jgi:hypothetical protein
MDDFVDSSQILDDPRALQARLNQDSYLFFSGLLPRAAVEGVRERVLSVLSSAGWTSGDGVAGGGARRENHRDPDWLSTYESIQSIQQVHELGHHPAMRSLMTNLLGDDLLVHPRKIVRVMLPSTRDDPSPVHQDYRVVQGSVDVLTAWVPLSDCPRPLGGLRILCGSTRIGLLPIAAAGGVFGQEITAADEHPRWVTIDYRAGDVLVFHSLTVHAGMPNRTSEIRLSADYRYQHASEPITIASLLPYYFPWLKGWEVLTKGWTSTEAIEWPRDVKTSPTFDAKTPYLGAPPSRLVEVGGVDRDAFLEGKE